MTAEDDCNVRAQSDYSEVEISVKAGRIFWTFVY
jgi:hypothetical protein